MGDSVKKFFEAIEGQWHTTTTLEDVFKKDDVVEEVKELMDKRSQKGIKEYGTTLADNPDGFWRWIRELQEELIDAVLYLQKIKRNK